MSWWSAISDFVGNYGDDILAAYGLYETRNNRKTPEMPDPIDPELLKAMMFQNSISPWGNMTWVEGDDGQMTSVYELTPGQQQLYDKMGGRALNPDQAMQMSSGNRAILDALTAKRMAQLGLNGGSSSAPGGGSGPVPF